MIVRHSSLVGELSYAVSGSGSDVTVSSSGLCVNTSTPFEPLFTAATVCKRGLGREYLDILISIDDLAKI